MDFLINPILKDALGWGTEADMDKVIRRGRKGLDGLANFVKHFIVKRGVNMGLFEGKLSYHLPPLPAQMSLCARNLNRPYGSTT